MKKVEYIIALILIMLGIVCLTMSGSYMLEQNIMAYAKMFIKVCLWMGIPISVVGVVYYFIIKRRGEEKE
ncbi:hypothetical protein ACFSCX_09150 [Bacillus salitolerans]|uniref:DUF3955 domain-containing protein n=1 Tax=Bacillus salitolerans TaxID=1437434 RepID=A0ABW4LNN5_9BACI